MEAKNGKVETLARRVLLVEDDDAVMQLIKIFLGRILPGCLVCEASGGQEAINLLGKEAFDVVIVDFNMPLINGVDVIEFILANCCKKNLA